MRKNLSKSVLYTLLAFGCFNLFMLTSCNDEASTTETTTTTTTTTETAPPATTTTTTTTAPPKDSLAVKAIDTPKMDKADTRPTEEGRKK